MPIQTVPLPSIVRFCESCARIMGLCSHSVEIATRNVLHNHFCTIFCALDLNACESSKRLTDARPWKLSDNLGGGFLSCVCVCSLTANGCLGEAAENERTPPACLLDFRPISERLRVETRNYRVFPGAKKDRPPDEGEAGSLNLAGRLRSVRNGSAGRRQLSAAPDRDSDSY
jgi:hypothetical protein